jgi:hypothetical protein
MKPLYAVQAEVPVTIQVNTQQSGSDVGNGSRGSNVVVPIDVDIGVELVVAGKPVGQGKASMMFDKCKESVAHLWTQCGGISYDGKDGTPQKFTSACEEGICVQKSEWFAMCIPEDQKQLFKKQGWSSKVLRCR